MTAKLLSRLSKTLFIGLLFWGSCALADEQGKDSPAPKKRRYLETGGERKLDVVYKTVRDQELELDIYYPTENRAEKSPVVIYTHGGGWATGSRFGVSNASFGVVHKALVKKGFCVVSVQYRLWSKNGQTMMRDCVIDAKDAIRYLAKNSEELGIDPMKFYTMGDSAGGHISQMLLLSSTESLTGDEHLAGTEYKMVAGVSWYGPCDFQDEQLFNHDNREGFRDRFGPRILGPDKGAVNKEKLYREMSPVTYLKPDSAPLLMIQGDKDTTIPVKQAYRMQQELKTVEAPVEIMIIKNAGHNWRSVDAPISPSRGEIVAATIQFFIDHL